jgi:hypothetical protein
MRNAILIGLSCLLLAACSESGSAKKPKAGYLPDSVAQDGGADASQPAAQPGGAPLSQNDAAFQAANDGRIAKIFVDWKVGALDPMDAVPQYKTAMRTDIRRLLRNQPISNASGKALYPRILYKAYRFATADAMKAEVEAWLNTQQHSGGPIVLGQPVKSFKSPPLLCYMTATDFVMVQWSCVYQGAEWDADVKRFLQVTQAEFAAYVWEVVCGTGEFRYHTVSIAN